MGTMIFCQKCGAPICFRSGIGERIPRKYRKKFKPVNIDGVEKRLCAECEEKEKG